MLHEGAASAGALLPFAWPISHSIISAGGLDYDRGLSRLGTNMKEDGIRTEPPIDLDPRALLGLSQAAKVSGKQEDVGRVLSKVGEGAQGTRPSRLAKLLSKIGLEGAPPPGESE
jgi:hypothetical protein